MITFPENFKWLDSEARDPWLNAQAYVDQLAREYALTTTPHPNLRGFDMFDMKISPVVRDSFIVDRGGSSFTTAFVYYKQVHIIRHRNYTQKEIRSHYEFFGYLRLNKDYGRAALRPETWNDKISEFFQPIEIDFLMHPEFSRRYYLLAENPVEFRNAISPAFLDKIAGFKGVQLEFHGNACLFRFSKSMNRNDLFNLAALGTSLDKILNHT